ncbi:MAG: dockerin type I domain-containing protein, partial [Hominilimicola sp.]
LKEFGAMRIKKYEVLLAALVMLIAPRAYAAAAEYKIQNDIYDADTKTYTAQVYLDTTEYLSAGSFGMQYDVSLSPSFTLDTDYFEYFQQFNSEGSSYIAFQWYIKDGTANTLTGRIHLGTITIPDVELDSDGKPFGWHKHTLRQLDWLTTNLSQTDKFTNTADGVCLNDEIWREFTDAEKEELTDKTINGYYQGYDMANENNPKWVDIGFTFDSSLDLPERAGQTISGTVQGYNPNNSVTVTLYRKGDTAVYNTVTPQTCTTQYPDGRVIFGYELAEVDEGEYTLEITKDVHLTYRADINVEAGKDVTKDKVTLYCGDIYADEKIKLDDRSILRRYLNMQISANSSEMVKRSDLNGDGRVTFHDLDILKPYYNKTYKGSGG